MTLSEGNSKRQIVCSRCGVADTVKSLFDLCRPCRLEATKRDLEWCKGIISLVWTGLPLARVDEPKLKTEKHINSRLRMLGWYLCHVTFQRGTYDIGKADGKDHTSISYGVELIEDLREVPAVDDALTLIETLANLRKQTSHTEKEQG